MDGYSLYIHCYDAIIFSSTNSHLKDPLPMSKLMNKKVLELNELNDEIEMAQKDVRGLNGKMSSIQSDVSDLETQVSK